MFIFQRPSLTFLGLLLLTLLTALPSYGAMGDADPRFGAGGRVVTPIDRNPGQALAAAEDAAGNLVAVGAVFYPGSSPGRSSSSDFAIVRYLPNGELDPHFGRAGIVTYNLQDQDFATGVTFDEEGRILVGGYSQDAASQSWIVLMRLLPDGTFDASFGRAGVVAERRGNGSAVHAMIRDSDARHDLLLVGESNADFLNRKFLGEYGYFTIAGCWTCPPNFTNDTNIRGIDKAYAVTSGVWEQPRYVLAGSSGNLPDTDFSIVRYYSYYSYLDIRFGPGRNGIVTTDIGINSRDEARGVAVQSDGKIVAFGTTGEAANSDFAVVRYDAVGALDTGFSEDGKLTFSVGTEDRGRAVFVLPDGKLLVVGDALIDGRRRSVVARLNSDGTRDLSFTRETVSTAAGEGEVEGAALTADKSLMYLAGRSQEGFFSVERRLINYQADLAVVARAPFGRRVEMGETVTQTFMAASESVGGVFGLVIELRGGGLSLDSVALEHAVPGSADRCEPVGAGEGRFFRCFVESLAEGQKQFVTLTGRVASRFAEISANVRSIALDPDPADNRATVAIEGIPPDGWELQWLSRWVGFGSMLNPVVVEPADPELKTSTPIERKIILPERLDETVVEPRELPGELPRE